MGIVSACLAGVASPREIKKSKRICIGASFLPPAAPVEKPRDPKVLICAPSNAAVDEIVMRIQNTGLLNKMGEACSINLMRLGRKEQASPKTHDVCFDTLLTQARRRGVSIRKTRQELIRKHQIICCTLSTAGSFPMCEFDHEFDMVIIDEGCQVGSLLFLFFVLFILFCVDGRSIIIDSSSISAHTCRHHWRS